MAFVCQIGLDGKRTCQSKRAIVELWRDERDVGMWCNKFQALK